MQLSQVNGRVKNYNMEFYKDFVLVEITSVLCW